jgi:choline-glycine betaine transporter
MKQEKAVSLSVNKPVFFIPLLLLVLMVVVSLVNSAGFLAGLNSVTSLILNNFAWLFNLTTLSCVFTVVIVYFSPLGKVRIGGSKATPILSRLNLVWVTLCTTIAAGILFWAAAEPMYQMYGPAAMEGVEPGSPEAAVFAMKTMFLEWTWSPYAIYTLATVLFAFVFYNMKKQFSIGSALVPLFGDGVSKFNTPLDIICLFALVAGMASSLGTGTLTLAGGVERMFNISSTPLSWGIIILVIVATFIVSSISGVTKGIRILSDINAKVYMLLLAFLLLFGPTRFMLNVAVDSYGAYLSDFFRLSLATGEIFNDGWAKGWPIFYWCNWLAWTPITAIFLGRILRGYTIKEAIIINFVIPSLFSTIWMGLFSTASIYFEMQGNNFRALLDSKGPEAVVYALFDKLPIPMLIIPAYLFIVFISFVTASDSNTTALAGLCTKGVHVEAESLPWMKIVWGLTIGLVTWILISAAGIDGIKSASNLGGFPNMFLMLLFIVCVLKISANPGKYDTYKEDYQLTGKTDP